MIKPLQYSKPLGVLANRYRITSTNTGMFSNTDMISHMSHFLFLTICSVQVSLYVLCYLWKDSISVAWFLVLQIFGAVQQEIRVSKAIEVMLTHVENLKRMYEKEHAELEETKWVCVSVHFVFSPQLPLWCQQSHMALHLICSSASAFSFLPWISRVSVIRFCPTTCFFLSPFFY